MTDVMSHFGHPYRENGNMLCPFHEEKNPSARLYTEQDTFWCWVCYPDHGVDVIEYVILAQGLEADAPSHLTAHKRHSVATILAVEYLEEVFGIGYEAEPWEARLNAALAPRHGKSNPEQFWNSQHQQLLLAMLSVDSPEKWSVYAQLMRALGRLKTVPSHHQMKSWRAARKQLSNL